MDICDSYRCTALVEVVHTARRGETLQLQKSHLLHKAEAYLQSVDVYGSAYSVVFRIWNFDYMKYTSIELHHQALHLKQTAANMHTKRHSPVTWALIVQVQAIIITLQPVAHSVTKACQMFDGLSPKCNSHGRNRLKFIRSLAKFSLGNVHFIAPRPEVPTDKKNSTVPS